MNPFDEFTVAGKPGPYNDGANKFYNSLKPKVVESETKSFKVPLTTSDVYNIPIKQVNELSRQDHEAVTI